MALIGFLLSVLAIALVIAMVIFSSQAEDAYFHGTSGRQEGQHEMINRHAKCRRYAIALPHHSAVVAII